MKLAHLLSEYLSINRRLDLPGIGIFTVDSSTIVEPENSKQSRQQAVVPGVVFENNPGIKESPDLIQFIATRTGKMKALAAADLDSHLELAQQFLNIGKPYLFEGIGSLVKLTSGQLAFTSGLIMPEKMKEYSVREISSTSTTEDSFSNYKNIFSPESTITKWRRPFIIFLLVAGVSFALWAGYTVYRTTTAKKKQQPKDEELAKLPEQTDTTSLVVLDSTSKQPADSTSATKKDSITLPGDGMANYKFVLEVANQHRAAERFARLKAFQWKIQMETKDSQAYKLFITVPALVRDTTRIIDSLTALNGKRVHIEY